METRDVTRWSIAVDGETTSAIVDRASDPDAAATFVFAHGAGGHMEDRGMTQLTDEFTRRSFHVVRFNFLYREQRSARPDPMPRLQRCIASVVDRARDALGARLLILGGRSMGGRAASMLVADGYACDGLLLLAYPLHPPGQLNKLRDAHIPRIRVPVLCFNGTRDTFCDRALMERAVTTATTEWTMHWLEGADHSFHVLKSSGRTDAGVLDEVRDAAATWMRVHGFAS